MKLFFNMTENSSQNLNIMRTRRAFKVKYKAFFINFKGLSVSKNCLSLESEPLMLWNSTVVWNLIQKVLTWKPNICCFCFEQHYQHGMFCLKFLPNLATNVLFTDQNWISKTMYSVICSYKKEIFLVYSSSEQVEFPRGYLTNIATCLFVYHQNRP